MSPRPLTEVDVTPGAHPFLGALGVVSFKLGCGCSRPPSPEPGPVVEFRHTGMSYPCTRHGEQIITRSTVRLTGWQKGRAGAR